jgi:hypothetical protein
LKDDDEVDDDDDDDDDDDSLIFIGMRARGAQSVRQLGYGLDRWGSGLRICLFSTASRSAMGPT